jgi:HK97 family phage prohead protease
MQLERGDSIIPLERSIRPGPQLRADGDDGMPTLIGYFSLFDVWTEIDSWFEGHFLERIAPGAFKKTFKEKAGQIKTLFQHGRDPVVGSKPLGMPEVLEEDQKGARAETPLLDTDYVREIIPGIQAGAYGQSFAFRVLREELVEEPGVSKDNPQGLAERTIKELELFEHGPVTWPQYVGTDAGVRAELDRAARWSHAARRRALLYGRAR